MKNLPLFAFFFSPQNVKELEATAADRGVERARSGLGSDANKLRERNDFSGTQFPSEFPYACGQTSFPDRVKGEQSRQKEPGNFSWHLTA